MTELSEKEKNNENLKYLDIKELINILKSMYDNASRGYKATMINLFGIKYATELKNQPIKYIALSATGKDSLYIEISKGIKLAKFLK